jgi:ABC-type transport system substrate-binding protein
MFDKLEAEFDLKRRKELLKKILTADAQAFALIPIGFAPRFYTVRDHVKGFSTDDDGSFVWFGGGLTRTWLDK